MRWIIFGRQVDTRLLKDRLYNPDGSQFNWNNRWNNNPYWVTLVNKNWDTRDRVPEPGRGGEGHRPAGRGDDQHPGLVERAVKRRRVTA